MSYKYEAKYPGDNKQDRLITEFLDKYFYAKAYPEYEIVTDPDAQSKGVDVIVKTQNGDECHDIRTQASKLYINHPKPMFAMEILTGEGANEMPGWFLRSDMLNHVYVLVWVNSAAVNSYGYIADAENIEELEVMFLDKQELKGFINTYLYDAAMYETARQMRAKGTQRLFPNDAMYLVYSDVLSGKPVTLTVKKWALEKCAYQHFKVRKSGITSLM